ncbi:hypothetical protein ACFVTC_41860 [Streptomyces sp. NPDC057950]|uniref:hypothetical protein n=1 Tax=Streptomyces sp. NPDC057950 TaxID=3346288 RepID=UPI0036E03230
MIGSFVGLVVFPMVIAGLTRWAAARRRRGLAAGRAVHFRCRLDSHKGRLLIDPRLDGPVFLDRSGNVTALARGGEALDATVSTNGRGSFEKVNLHYRTPDGLLLRLRLATHDARTLGAWLGEQPRPVSAPARRLFLPCAPSWAVLALAASLFVGLVTADVALLGKHTAAEVVRVNMDDDSCTVGWDGGVQRAAVDCVTTDVHSGDRIRITALPWPFLGEAVNTRTALTLVAVLGGGIGLLGLAGALMVNPLACARRVRLARRGRPAIPPRADAGGEADEDRWPALDDDLSYASLAAAARHGDRHRPGPRVTPPRRGFGRTSVSPHIWVLTTVLGTNAWYSLGFSSSAILEDLVHLGHWRFLVFGTIGIASLARIGWVATDRSALCGPVLRAARSDAEKSTWRPMRYVRLCRDPGEMGLVLFRPEGGEVTAPLFLQPISRSRGSERRTVGGPAPVGEALVLDTGVGPLICEIDGVRYLPGGRATEAATDPARTRDELRSFAESHLRRVGRS